jgi:hypothetical protein
MKFHVGTLRQSAVGGRYGFLDALSSDHARDEGDFNWVSRRIGSYWKTVRIDPGSSDDRNIWVTNAQPKLSRIINILK